MSSENRPEPGERGVTSYPVARLASGQDLALTALVSRGSRPGPTVVVMSGAHGEEVFTVEMCRRVWPILEPGAIKGTVVMVSLANGPAFASGSRNTPVDMLDMNRAYPGTLDGWLTQKMAAVVVEKLLVGTDLLIDYHCGGSDTDIWYSYTEPRTTAYGRQVDDLACASGASILWRTDSLPPGTLSGYTKSKGAVAVTLEIGGGPTLEREEWLGRGVNGLVNVLRTAGVLDGDPMEMEPRITVNSGIGLRPRHGGLFLPEAQLETLGGTVVGGTVLGRVVCPHTFSELDTLVAPFKQTEVMMIRTRISRVEPGDYAYILGDGTVT